jgi:hypothetical protein
MMILDTVNDYLHMAESTAQDNIVRELSESLDHSI